MYCTAEISMYPLRESYKEPIIAFIEDLKKHDQLELRVSSTSTRVFGPWEDLHRILGTAMQRAFQAEETTVMVVKYFNRDLREEPDL